MAEFYIEKAEKESGAHIVHFASCNALPPVQELEYLGSISTFSSATTEGKKKYLKVDPCPDCASKYVAA